MIAPLELGFALARTTLATAAAACLATCLLAWLKVDSPRTHRIAWALVVLQGWLLVPWTLHLPAAPAPRPSIGLPRITLADAGQVQGDFDSCWIEPEAIAPVGADGRGASAAALATLVAWLAGGALLVLLAMRRYVRIVRALPLGAVPERPQWRREWRRQRRAMGVRRRAGFRMTEQLGPL
ncbi:MAG TPA: hypothetical protein PKC18_20675, partial [Lacipirellulaceae bacterium]|nr:hypothetical protein [Lacipirellulaceae bacterium]